VTSAKEANGKPPQGEERHFSRGLPSIDQVRRQRAKTSSRWRMSPKIWMWVGIVMVASFIYWWMTERSEIQSMRSEVLARQRAIVAELGPRWFPLRDRIEGWAMQCSSSGDELVAEDVLASWDFRSMPGIYLRLASFQARTPERIRQAAQHSLHDGFTACLLLVPNPNPLKGPTCKTAGDCAVGQHCNSFGHCAKHSQPYNLRLAYKTMRLLSDEWVREVQSATDELTMRGATATFDAVNHYEIPVAVELLTKAKYFLVVVDEAQEPSEGAELDAGGGRTIPAKPHDARVCAWRLEDDRRVLAVTRPAAGVLRGGAAAAADEEAREALQRQANSCALALAVREAMGDDSAAKVPEEPDAERDGGDGKADAAADGGER